MVDVDYAGVGRVTDHQLVAAAPVQITQISRAERQCAAAGAHADRAAGRRCFDDDVVGGGDVILISTIQFHAVSCNRDDTAIAVGAIIADTHWVAAAVSVES